MITQGHNLLINFHSSYHILSICCNKNIYKYQLFYREINVLSQVNWHHYFVKISPPNQRNFWKLCITPYWLCIVFVKLQNTIFWNTGKTNFCCWMKHHNLTLCSIHNYLSFYFMYLKHLPWLHKQGRWNYLKQTYHHF